MLPSDIIVRNPPMHLRLELKKRCELFWLKDIRDVDISKCCAKCFIGKYDPNFWDATHGKSEGGRGCHSEAKSVGKSILPVRTKRWLRLETEHARRICS